MADLERTDYGETRSVFTDHVGDELVVRFTTPGDRLDVSVYGDDDSVELTRGQQMALVRMILERHNGPTYPNHPVRRSYDVPNV